MNYFRLPPPVPKHVQAELRRIRTKLSQQEKDERQGVRKGKSKSAAKSRTLDGFRLLEATQSSEPEDVVEAYLTNLQYDTVVAEDMAYFTNLEFIDAGENCLHLGDFAMSASLQELHLHCNAMNNLNIKPVNEYLRQRRIYLESLKSEDNTMDEASTINYFAALDTLNLSYNCLPGFAISDLFELRGLVRLDLSYNPLVTLPPDLSVLHCLERLALEKSGLDGDCLAALGTLPALVEVNLNYNVIQNVGVNAVRNGWQNIKTIGLVGNPIATVEGLTALLRINSLQRVVCWGTLLVRNAAVVEEAQRIFSESHITLDLSEKRDTTRSMIQSKPIRVENFATAKLYKKSKKNVKALMPPPSPPSPSPPPPKSPPKDSTPGFFLTETDLSEGGDPLNSALRKAGGELTEQGAQILEDADYEIAAMHQRRRHTRQGTQLPTVSTALTELKRVLHTVESKPAEVTTKSRHTEQRVRQRKLKNAAELDFSQSHPSISAKGMRLPPVSV